MTGRCEPKLSTAIKVKEVLGVDMPLEELFDLRELFCEDVERVRLRKARF